MRWPLLLAFAACACLSIDNAGTASNAPTGGNGGTLSAGGAAGWPAGGAGFGGIGGADAGADGDADASDAPAEADAASGKGSVACGSITCSAASEFCCVYWGDGGTTPECHAAGSGCAGEKIKCDGAEDCAGLRCCVNTNSTVGCSSDCSSTVLYGVAQICKADSECPAGQTCQPVSGLLLLAVPPGYRVCH